MWFQFDVIAWNLGQTPSVIVPGWLVPCEIKFNKWNSIEKQHIACACGIWFCTCLQNLIKKYWNSFYGNNWNTQSEVVWHKLTLNSVSHAPLSSNLSLTSVVYGSAWKQSVLSVVVSWHHRAGIFKMVDISPWRLLGLFTVNAHLFDYYLKVFL